MSIAESNVPTVPAIEENPEIATGRISDDQENLHAQINDTPPERVTAYIDTEQLSPLMADQAKNINRALTRHAVFSDQKIANIISEKVTKAELMRLDRGATVIDRIKENVKMPDFRDKLKKLAWNGLKYGYWGFFAYGVITGTSPLGVVKDIGSIPGRIGDLLSSVSENLTNLFGGASEVVDDNPTPPGDTPPVTKPEIPTGKLFDMPLFDANGNMTNQGGAFFNMFKPLLGKDIARKLTKTIGTPFVGIFGSLSKNTKYPVEGKWGPFLAYPAIYYGGEKLGVWNELYTRLKGDSSDNLNQMKIEEIEKLKEKARNVLLSGDWEGYTEIRLAIDNIGKRYKGIEDQLIRQRRALAA